MYYIHLHWEELESLDYTHPDYLYYCGISICCSFDYLDMYSAVLRTVAGYLHMYLKSEE